MSEPAGDDGIDDGSHVELSPRWAALARPPQDLVFDDESVDAILYGEPAPEPTPANISAPIRRWLRHYAADADLLTEDAFRDIVLLLEQGPPISPEIFESLLGLVGTTLPEWPHPPRRPPIPSAGALLEALARLPRERNDATHLSQTDELLWQWYEFEGRHAEARQVLDRMYQAAERLQRPDSLCRIANGIGFQFLLEENWGAAQAQYERACELARRTHNEASWTSDRILWWACRWEAEGHAAAAQMMEELPSLQQACQRRGDRMANRRALVYLAHGLAALGRRQEAVRAAEAAVAIDRDVDTIYLAEDEAILAQLRSETAP